MKEDGWRDDDDIGMLDALDGLNILHWASVRIRIDHTLTPTPTPEPLNWGFFLPIRITTRPN